MSLLEHCDASQFADNNHPDTLRAQARVNCERLEAGRILFFANSPVALSAEDRQFLLTQRQHGSRLHKNISYRPKNDAMRGFAAENDADGARLHAILRDYSQRVIHFLSGVLQPYAAGWSIDFASFRPLEEQGRDLPLHKRNDLLHVDAFPTRPTHGGRILRFFTNVNPTRPRVWHSTAEPFAALAQHFAAAGGAEAICRAGPLAVARRLAPRAATEARRRTARARSFALRRVHAPLSRLPQGERRPANSLGEGPHRVSAELLVDRVHRRRTARRPLRPIRAGADVHHPGRDAARRRTDRPSASWKECADSRC